MKAEHELAALGAALAVTRSGDQAWRTAEASARTQADAVLLPKIQALHRQHKGRYGAPRIRQNWQRKA